MRGITWSYEPYEPVFIGSAVIKVPLRLVTYNIAPTILDPPQHVDVLQFDESLSSKFAPVTFPARIHLGHELNESRIFSDRIEKRVAFKERIAWDALLAIISLQPKGSRRTVQPTEELGVTRV